MSTLAPLGLFIVHHGLVEALDSLRFSLVAFEMPLTPFSVPRRRLDRLACFTSNFTGRAGVGRALFVSSSSTSRSG